MDKTPYPHIEERPLPDKFGAGMSWIARWTSAGLAEADWWHSMVGTLWGTDGYFRMPSVYAATDYGVGGIRDGAYDGVIFRWINYFERRNTAGWASGWGDDGPGIEGDGQALLDQLGGRAINGTGRSIELSGLVADVVTAKQWAAAIHLSAAIHHHELNQGYEEYAWNMHHKEVAIKDCPFPRVYNHTVEYQTATILIMEHYETGRDIPETVKIAGLDVKLAGGADPAPGAPAPGKPIFIPFPRITKFTARRGALSRQWAWTGADIVRRYAEGTTLRCSGYYFGEEVNGEDRWLVIRSSGPSNNARIHASGVKEKIVDPGIGEA